jgi:short-subunit dehydrogenase
VKPSIDVAERVAVVTGAARGVGLALALHAADNGMPVALADSDQDLLETAVEQVRAKGVEAIGVCSDMFDWAAARELARRSAAELGPPWLVCNNPGVSIEVNLWGVINGVQAFAPGMARRDAGHIVNILAAELFGMRGAARYVATSQAILHLSEELYRELDSKGSQVGVTLVCPALVKRHITDIPEHQPGNPSLQGTVALNALPPEEIAAEIFAAVAARRFRVFPERPDQSFKRRAACLDRSPARATSGRREMRC